MNSTDPQRNNNPIPKGSNYTSDDYIKYFRTQRCRKNDSCQNKSSCFYYHSLRNKRREIGFDPDTSSYICHYCPVKCKYFGHVNDCPDGANCEYAHTFDEVLYHPSTYKTRQCPFPTNSTGFCARYGRNCSKAHSREELREIEVLPGAEELTMADAKELDFEQQRSTANSPLSIEQSNHEKENIARGNENTKQGPEPESKRGTKKNTDEDFFIYEYKTKRCNDSSCVGNRHCTQYHCNSDRRRSVLKFNYERFPCSFAEEVTPEGRFWRKNINCPSGDFCNRTHSIYELLYHPDRYKVDKCDRKVCNNKECAFYHSEKDRRIIQNQNRKNSPREVENSRKSSSQGRIVNYNDRVIENFQSLNINEKEISNEKLFRYLQKLNSKIDVLMDYMEVIRYGRR